MSSIAATRRTRGPGVPRRDRRRNSLRRPTTSTAGTAVEAVGAWRVRPREGSRFPTMTAAGPGRNAVSGRLTRRDGRTETGRRSCVLHVRDPPAVRSGPHEHVRDPELPVRPLAP